MMIGEAIGTDRFKGRCSEAMTSRVRQIAELIFDRYAINDSWPYTTYLQIRYPRHMRRQKQARKFLSGLLGCRTSKVFDIGANCGNKARVFASVAKEVVCVEPSPKAAETIRRRFVENDNVKVVAVGVAEEEGTSRLHVFGATNCFNTFSKKQVAVLVRESAIERVSEYEVQVTTLDALIDRFGIPDYIKIDVEGYEASVLRGLTQPVRLVSFEANLPCFGPETIECMRILNELHSDAVFNYCRTDPPLRFELPSWVSLSEMETIVSLARPRYLEIYCTTRLHSDRLHSEDGTMMQTRGCPRVR